MYPIVCKRNLCPANVFLQLAGTLANSIRCGWRGQHRARRTSTTESWRSNDSAMTHGDGAPYSCPGRYPWSVGSGATNERTRTSWQAGWRTPCRIDGSLGVAHPPNPQRGRSHLFRGVLKRQGASNEPRPPRRRLGRRGHTAMTDRSQWMSIWPTQWFRTPPAVRGPRHRGWAA
jgi:hypothetical protein